MLLRRVQDALALLVLVAPCLIPKNTGQIISMRIRAHGAPMSKAPDCLTTRLVTFMFDYKQHRVGGLQLSSVFCGIECWCQTRTRENHTVTHTHTHTRSPVYIHCLFLPSIVYTAKNYEKRLMETPYAIIPLKTAPPGEARKQVCTGDRHI